MNKTLKWILIGLAIAAGAFIISLPVMFMIHNGGWIGMMDGYGLRDGLRDGMRTSSFHSPMRMFPFFGMFGFARLLIPLGVIALAVYGVIALVRRRPAHAASSASVAVVTPAPAAAAAESAEIGKCTTCGRERISEGEFCPFCGARQ